MNRDLKMVIAGSGLTNYEIELKAGLPLTKLSRLIHGATQPNEDEMKAVAEVLGVRVGDIFNSSETLGVA